MQSVLLQGRKLIHSFASDSLLRNAVYLFASTAIMAVLGFAFWLFVARLYSPADIGVASAVIAATILVGNLSMLGLNSGLIRFLPGSKNQSADINAAILAVGGASLIAGAGFMAGSALFGSPVPLIGYHPWAWLMLLFVFVAVSLNSLTDGVFISNRKAEYHLAVYSAFGVTRLLLPLGLVALGAVGVFGAYAGAVIVSLVLSIFFMIRACKYLVWTKPNWRFILNARRFAIGNYLSTVISGLPQQLMPTIIIASMGATSSAYFALALTMANLLFIIPTVVSQSLMAESSHKEHQTARNLRHAAKILTFTLVPVVALAVGLAKYVLALFGPAYAAGSVEIFQLLALATIFVAINSVASTVLNLKHRPLVIVAVQVVIAVVTLGLTKLLAGQGLAGIGFAMLAGYAVGSLCYIGLLVEAAIRQRKFL